MTVLWRRRSKVHSSLIFCTFLYCIAYFFHSLGIEYRGQKNYYNNSNNVVRGFNASRISDFLYAVLSSSATASVGVLMSRWLQFRRRYRQSCKTINFLFNFFNYFVPLLFVAFPSIYTAKCVLWKTSKPINKEKQNITIARTNRKKTWTGHVTQLANNHHNIKMCTGLLRIINIARHFLSWFGIIVNRQKPYRINSNDTSCTTLWELSSLRFTAAQFRSEHTSH